MYRDDPNFSDSTGLQADHYSVRCIADAITPDHFEGRISNEVRTIGGDLQEITLTHWLESRATVAIGGAGQRRNKAGPHGKNASSRR